jgi:hypothetical protein
MMIETKEGVYIQRDDAVAMILRRHPECELRRNGHTSNCLVCDVRELCEALGHTIIYPLNKDENEDKGVQA